MAITITICRYCLVALLAVLPTQGAPRSKSSHRSAPETVYDQKQNGLYNFQVHMKDFEIVAVLGDDALGDYDYNYDYSDFTLKPSTPKPTTGSTTSQPQSTTTPIKEQPSSTSTTTTQASTSSSIPQESSENAPEEPLLHTDKEKDKEPTVNEAGENSTSSTNTTKEVEVEVVESVTIKRVQEPEEPNSPGKIKVQIIETPVGIVPGEVTDKDGAAAQGEVLHVRRCAQGYARDKRGRCRRVRRPAVSSRLPYGFNRLANNLASKLRYGSSEESLPSSESRED